SPRGLGRARRPTERAPAVVVWLRTRDRPAVSVARFPVAGNPLPARAAPSAPRRGRGLPDERRLAGGLDAAERVVGVEDLVGEEQLELVAEGRPEEVGAVGV